MKKHSIDSSLKTMNLVSLSEDGGFVDITPSEKKFFMDFIKIANQKASFTFRGDSGKRLIKKLIKWTPEPDKLLSVLAELIFVFGSKGKYFYESGEKGVYEDYDRKYLKDIYDISAETFSFIFERTNSLLRIKERSVSSNQFIKLSQFKQANIDFVKYFGNHANKNCFIEKVNAISALDQLAIRDYYLHFLHSANAIKGIERISFFISTTPDFNVAQNFIGDDRSGIILGILLANEIKSSNSLYISDNFPIDILVKNELPIILEKLYENQNEILFKGIIPAHYIPYFIHKASNQIIISPNLLNCQLDKVEEILDQGIPIDQSFFLEDIRRTNYTSFGALTADLDILEYKN